MIHFRIPLLGSVLALTSAALAQTPAPKQPAPEIVVTGSTPVEETRIDRKVYDVTRDLQATTGTASDILRNLPSVDVDVEGNVSLRGDSNVQILIDGKPSATLSQASRGETLQQLPADSIARVEIITNPSAKFNPDGAAGIINIITKKNRKRGRSGSVQLGAGTDNRVSLGLNAAYNPGRYTLYGNFNVRQDSRRRIFSDRRTRIDPLTGQTRDSRQDSIVRSRRQYFVGTVGIDYNLTKRDQLGASVNYNTRVGKPTTQDINFLADSTGAVASDYTRTSTGFEREPVNEVKLKYAHTLDKDLGEFTLDVSRGQKIETQLRRYTSVFRTPVQPNTIEEQQPHANEIDYDVAAELTRKFASGSSIDVGYKLSIDDNTYRTDGASINPATLVRTPSPALSSAFTYQRTIHALYGIYEFAVTPKLGANLGLRLEQAQTDFREPAANVAVRRTYFRVYPTMNLRYDLGDDQNLRLNYAHRITRPEADDLRAAPVFQDPLNQRAGNPNLLPQESDLVELGYDGKANGYSWSATAYARRNTNQFIEVSRFIGPNTLLTRRENAGSSLVSGLEFSSNGKLNPKLSYALSGNIFYTRINAANLGFATSRANVSYTAKTSFDYRFASKDVAQISANFVGPRLTAQGFRRPGSVVNLGFRHPFSDTVNVVLTLSDLFDTQRDRVIIDTPTLRSTVSRRRASRTFALALTWRFGQTSKKANADTRFDYTTPGNDN